MRFHQLYISAIQLYHHQFGYYDQGNDVLQYNQPDF